MTSPWNQRFDTEDYVYGTEPNDFLKEQCRKLARPGMRALSIGDGEGRNGVWLAQQGLNVLAVDSSDVGLRKAERLAKSRNTRIETVCQDLLAWDWPKAEFDLAAAIFIHFRPEARRAVHASLMEALRPGGVLILEAFRPAQLDFHSGGPKDADLLYTAEMLAEDFAEADILELEETLRELDEGPFHQGTAAVVRLAARKAKP
jgi:SAM-dependent methyltransferase